MTNIQKFAAQQLTKKQMTEVKGGVVVDCYTNGQWVGKYEAKSKADAEAYIKTLYGSGYCD